MKVNNSMPKRIFWALLMCILLPFFCLREAVSDEALDLLIREALDNNPEIQASYSMWKAAEYKIKGVKGFPDPMISYAYFGESVQTRVGPQEHKYGLSQKVPFPGKLGLKGKAQAKQAEALKEKYEAARREVIKDVKFVYYDIFWVDKAIKITEGEKAILESLEKVAQKRFELNNAPQQDVIKVQVELSKLIDKLYLLRQNRNSLAAKLYSIINKEQKTELENITQVRIKEFGYSLEELHEIARASRQELLAANLDIERAGFEKSLARLEYLPDITLGFDYIEVGSGRTTSPDDGDDAWMGSVAVNVPVWFNKLNAQLNEKKSSLDAKKKKYEDMENKVNYEVADLYFKIKAYKDIILLYKTALIPQTEQSFDAAKTAYETGKTDFLNWLDAERMLLQVRLAYYKSMVDYEKSIAYLERVVGRDL